MIWFWFYTIFSLSWEQFISKPFLKGLYLIIIIIIIIIIFMYSHVLITYLSAKCEQIETWCDK